MISAKRLSSRNSGRPRAEVLESLQRFGLSKCFKEVVAMEDVAEQKPNPAGLLLLMSRMKSSSSKTIFVASGIADARAAKEAGIPFIGVLPPSAEKKAYSDQLKSEGAIHVLDSINSLKSVLG
ncbi:HAD family hydrolase [Candidatus Woesearchaeota archaeon]|nr:HAD family hydrolase [Candidatus Woesearchaeota archaeon]